MISGMAEFEFRNDDFIRRFYSQEIRNTNADFFLAFFPQMVSFRLAFSVGF